MPGLMSCGRAANSWKNWSRHCQGGRNLRSPAMKRLVPICLLLAMSAPLEAAPARPLYEPPPPPPTAPNALDFRGTQWFGKTYEGTDWTIIFEPNGGIT